MQHICVTTLTTYMVLWFIAIYHITSNSLNALFVSSDCVLIEGVPLHTLGVPGTVNLYLNPCFFLFRKNI